jgi:single-strand DNA-binding protein
MQTGFFLRRETMPGLNRVQLIGNLGKDPESRFTPTGKKVCHFSLAASRRWKTGEGETREATDWFNVEAWGRLAEICQDYLKKGSLVYIEGRLQTHRYEHEGETRHFTKVIARQMQMLDRRVEEEPALEAIEEEPVPE